MLRIKRIAEFSQLNNLAKLQVLLVVLCIFCGQSALGAYVPHMMILISAISFYFLCDKRIHFKPIYFSKRYGFCLLIVLIVLFIGWQVYFVSFNPDRTMVYFRRYFLYSIFFFFVLKSNSLYAAIKISEGYAILCGVTYLFDTFLNGSTAGGLFGTYHGAGMMMSVACFMFATDYFYYKQSSKKLICYLFSLLCVVISTKRMFMLLSVLGLLIPFLLTSNYAKIRKFFKIISIIIVGGVLAYQFVPQVQNAFGRFALSFLTDDETISSSGRNILWKMAIEIFNSHKIVGVGFSNFIDYSGVHYSNPWAGVYHTHGIYYGLLAETGIVGFTLFVTLFIVVLFSSLILLRNARRLGQSKFEYLMLHSIAMQMWFIIYGFTGNGIYDANEFFLYTFAAVIMLSTKTAIIRGDLEVGS